MNLLALLAAIGATAFSCPTGGAAPSAVQYSRFHGNWHNAIVRVNTRRKLVALTFDDGPTEQFTPHVLRILRRHRARATFFVIGLAALYRPHLIRAERAAGMEIANHTLSHPRLAEFPVAAIAAEILLGARAIEAAGAPPPRLFRPPFGLFDERVGMAAALDCEPMIGWEMAFDRYDHHIGSPRPAAVALAQRAKPGSILLMHDGMFRRQTMLAALPVLLDALRARGFRVVTVSELLRSRAGPAPAGPLL